jgi:hypothetical protein
MHRWAHNTVFDPRFKFDETFDCAPKDICDALSVNKSPVDEQRS